jgi:hypothetical protein
VIPSATAATQHKPVDAKIDVECSEVGEKEVCSNRDENQDR